MAQKLNARVAVSRALTKRHRQDMYTRCVNDCEIFEERAWAWAGTQFMTDDHAEADLAQLSVFETDTCPYLAFKSV